MPKNTTKSIDADIYKPRSEASLKEERKLHLLRQGELKHKIDQFIGESNKEIVQSQMPLRVVRSTNKSLTHIVFRRASGGRSYFSTLTSAIDYLRKEGLAKYIDVKALSRIEVGRQNLNYEWAIRQSTLVRCEVLLEATRTAKKALESLDTVH